MQGRVWSWILGYQAPGGLLGRLRAAGQAGVVLAAYFGSVGIRKTRHAVSCGLAADLAGILGAIAVTYFFFG
jgi:spore maturation protein SpmB